MSTEISSQHPLHLLHDVSLALVREAKAEGAPDFTLRQIGILLTVYLEPPPHTVRGLARKLGVTKPVVTRALDSMGKLSMIARERDGADRRNVIVQRTETGALYVERLASLMATTVRSLG